MHWLSPRKTLGEGADARVRARQELKNLNLVTILNLSWYSCGNCKKISKHEFKLINHSTVRGVLAAKRRKRKDSSDIA